jgi:hypothetical protein
MKSALACILDQLLPATSESWRHWYWRFQASLGPMGEWADGRMGMAV